MKRPAVFLDRDNTLIHNDGDLGDPEGVRLIQGVAPAIASVRGLGYRVFVITNQGGVARGKYTEEDVRLTNERLAEMIAQAANGAEIDAFYYCPYHPEAVVAEYRGEHESRKPRPGMILQAAEEHGVDLARSWTIGDQMRDVQAGAAAGTRTILLRPDADALTPLDVAATPGVAESPEEVGGGAEGVVRPDFLASSMVEAVRIIAHQRKPKPAPEDVVAEGPGGLPPGRRWDAAAVARIQRPRTPKEAGESPQAAAREPNRSFRPVGAPEPQEARPIVIPKFKQKLQEVVTEARQRAKREHGEPDQADVPPKPAPPTVEAEPVQVATPTIKAEPVAAPPPPVIEEPAAPPQTEPEGLSAEPVRFSRSTTSGQRSDRVLHQILQELRAQRGAREFSGATVFALVLQMGAVICLLGGLWMGADDMDLFVRWLGTGLILQLATIALLLFTR